MVLADQIVYINVAKSIISSFASYETSKFFSGNWKSDFFRTNPVVSAYYIIQNLFL